MESNFQKSRDNAETERDPLDGMLDAALAKYSAVEPRAGLEQRILAHVRSEQNRIPARSWWQWGAAGLVAAAVVIVMALGWKSSRPAKLEVQRAAAPIQTVQPPATQASANGGMQTAVAVRLRHKATRHHVHPPMVVADGPKLDQFPSPRPLTDEEIALTRYVHSFPKEALLIAQAQALEEMEIEKQMTQETAKAESSGIQEER